MATVTRSNFQEVYDSDIKRSIEEADFYAIDMEFTGVESAQFRRSNELDNIETRYLNLRQSASSFGIVQFGLCTVRWDADKKTFITKPFNFHVFPRATGAAGSQSRNFLSQISSMEFLADHNMDFNAWIRNGLSYISEEQEEATLTALSTERDTNLYGILEEESSEIPLTSTGLTITSTKLVQTVTEWRDSVLKDLNQRKGSAGSPPQDSKHEDMVEASRAISKLPNKIMPQLSSRDEKLLRQAVRKRFTDVLVVPEGRGHSRHLRIVYCPKGVKAKFVESLHNEKIQLTAASLKKARGIRIVIDALFRSGKPLIGHNCILDLMHLYDKFVGPLPVSAPQFFTRLAEKLPCIVDTKYLVLSEFTLRSKMASEQSSLGLLYDAATAHAATTEGSFQIQLEQSGGRYQDSSFRHEAGYDALMTAVLFVHSCQMLNVDPAQVRSLSSCISNWRAGVRNGDFMQSAHVESLPTGIQRIAFRSNSLIIGRQSSREMVVDLFTGKLAGGLRQVSSVKNQFSHRDDRHNVLLAWNLPPNSQVSQLRKSFHDLQASRKAPFPYVYFLDATAALVEFTEPSVAQRVRAAMDSRGSELTEKGVRMASFTDYKRLCASLASFSTAAEGVATILMDAVSPVLPRTSEQGASPSVVRHEAGAAELGQESRKRKLLTEPVFSPVLSEGPVGDTGGFSGGLFEVVPFESVEKNEHESFGLFEDLKSTVSPINLFEPSDGNVPMKRPKK